MNPAPPVMTTLGRATVSLDATRDDVSTFLPRPEAFGQCVDGFRAMRYRVLRCPAHLRERLRGPSRDRARLTTEPAAPALPVRNRPAALSVKDLVVVRRPQEEHRLEPGRTVSSPLQQLQDARTAEALVYVRRVHAREAAKLFDEESGIIDQIVPADLVVEDGRCEPDDLLETVRLDLRVRAILVDQLDVGLAEFRRDLAELTLVRRDEGDQVYRPRDSISFTFAMTSSAIFPIVSRYPRSASRWYDAARACALPRPSLRRWRSTPRASTPSSFPPKLKSIITIRPSRTIMFEVVRSPWMIPARWRRPTIWPIPSATFIAAGPPLSRTSFAVGPSMNSMMILFSTRLMSYRIGTATPAARASDMRRASWRMRDPRSTLSRTSRRYAFGTRCFSMAARPRNSVRRSSASAPRLTSTRRNAMRPRKTFHRLRVCIEKGGRDGNGTFGKSGNSAWPQKSTLNGICPT